MPPAVGAAGAARGCDMSDGIRARLRRYGKLSKWQKQRSPSNGKSSVPHVGRESSARSRDLMLRPV